MRRLIPLLLGLTAASGCEQVREGLEERARRKAAPTAPTSEASADPAQAAEARRARFDARPTVAPPTGLPRAWQGVPGRLKGKLTGASIRERIGRHGVRHVHLQVRAFDTDAQVNQRLLATLKGLRLKMAPAAWPAEDVVEGDGWSAEVGRLKAPPKAARGHRVELDWRALDGAKPRGECKKRVPSLKAPKRLPAWLGKATRPEEQRWRVAREVSAYPKLERVRLWVLYRNGYTQDDHVGRLQKAAQANGFALVDGSGPNQRWKGDDGQALSWRPHRDSLGLPCTPVGPTLEVTWERVITPPKPKRKAGDAPKRIKPKAR